MTATNQTLADLSDDHRRLLESWVMDFDQHWDEDRLAAAVKQVPRDHPLRPLALAEMVKIDLERRWRQGRKAKLEAYLRALPELGTPDSVALDLIQAEVEARRQAGAPVALADFAARFPHRADELRRCLEPPAASSTLPDAAPAAGAPSTLSAAPAAAAATLPEQFGRYRIIRKLGQGGMGAVYLAHDTQLDRPVALKVPRFTPEDSPELLERFHREARAAATLRHPHICPVYDVGQIDGVHYLTMAYIEGRLMSELVRAGQPLPQPQAAALVRLLALALAHAHAHGVIHRDLKPANVMLNQDGDPAVMDFGLARQVNKEGERLTKSGVVMGTPAYMSPEQVEGDVAAMGPGCDVYSLGVILYELLTGRLPFTGSMAAVLGQIVSQPPERPSAFRPDLNPQLESIVMKAMAKKIGDRYRSMDEFAAALTGYLHTNPPPAGPANRVAGYFPPEATAPPTARTGPRRRRSRWPWLVGLGAVALVALGIGIALNGGSGGDQTRPTFSDPAARGSGDPPAGTSRKAPPAGEFVQPKLVRELTLPDVKGYGHLCISPDHKTLAARNGTTAELWDLTTGKRRAQLKEHPGEIHHLAFSADGKKLAVGTYKQIFVWDVDKPEDPLILRGHTDAVHFVHFNPEGTKLVSLSHDRTLRQYDLEKRQGEEKIKGLAGRWTLAPDEKALLVGETLIDLGTFKWRVLDSCQYNVQFSQDSKTLGEAGREKVWLWDLDTAKYRVIHEDHTDTVTSAVLCRDGKTVASGSADKTVILYDTATKEERVLKAHAGPVAWVWPLADGKTLASFSNAEPTVKFWDIATGGARGSIANANNLKFVHYGPKMVVTVDDKGVAKVWDLAPER